MIRPSYMYECNRCGKTDGFSSAEEAYKYGFRTVAAYTDGTAWYKGHLCPECAEIFEQAVVKAFKLAEDK